MGQDEGFMFTARWASDDTGGILWGPQTLDAAARQQGVHLTEDYQHH